MSYQEWKERKKRESEEQSEGSASSTQESSGYQKWKQKNGLGTGASTAKKETRLGTSGSSKTGTQDKKSYRTAQMDAVIQKKNERNSTVQRGWEAYQADREAKLKEEQEKPWWQNLAENMQKASYADLPGVNILQLADQYREDTSWQEPSDRWDEAHKRQFGYLYATDPEEARDYAAEFNDYLDRVEKQKKQEALKEQATKEYDGFSGIFKAAGNGVVQTAKAIGAGMGGVGEYIQDVAELTGRGRITERGTYLSPTEYSGAITGGISEHLNEKWGTLDEEVPVIGGKGLGDVYQLGTSVAQSMASAHTLGGLGTLVSYFGQAAASNVDDARNRGASDEQAVAYGALTGLAEGLAEQIDIKQLQALGSAASLKELFGGMLKQGTSEMIEEGVTSLIDTFADNLVLQDKSLMNVRTVEYMANGMTEEEARKRAWLDAAEDTAYDMLGGFVSGGVSGGLETGVKSVGINRNYSSFYGDSAQELVQEGLESPEGSEARALAEAYQLRLDKGENLNGVEIYRMMEANEQQFRAEAELAAENESAIETEENLNPEIVGDSRETEAQEAAVELAEQESGGELGLEEADAVGVIREGIRDLGLAESEEQLLADNFGDGDADQETYIAGIRTAYKYGELGIPERELLRPGNFTDELTENQRRTAYQLGVLYGKEKAAREQAAVKARNTVPGGTGKVQFDGDWNKLNVQQTAGLKALDTVADALGVEFRIYESYENAQGEQVYRDEKGNEASAPNGFYREGVIHLDLNAGSNAQGTILFTAAHELTHFMKQWSPEGYRRMTDVLMEGYASRGQNVTELVEKQIRLAKSQGIELSYEAAFEEVAADSMESMLADGTIVEDLARLKETDRTVWEKVRDWFRDFAEAIRKAYAKLKPDSAEGRMVAEMKETAERLQKLFEEGLVDAGGNFRGAEKNTAGEGGETDHDDAVKRSLRIVDQIRNSLPEIMELDSVYDINTDNAVPFTANRKMDANSGNAVFVAQGGAVNRPGFGRVVLSKRGAIQTVAHGNGPAKQASFPAIKAVIEKGIEIYRETDHNGQGFDTVTFSAPVNFFGKAAPLAAVVKTFYTQNADKTFYIHEICDAEGNYIRLGDEKNSSTNYAEPTSAISATVDGISPNSSIRDSGGDVNTKFSLRTPVEQTKTLVAMHNLTADKLMKAIELGGFPMPSIAVTKADIPHTNFGEITLVMNKSTVDPKASKKNVVYSADAWTPTFPQIEYREEIRQLRSDHREAMKKQAKEASDRYQASRKNASESRKRTEMRHKIQKTVKKLNDLLLNETRDRHVPEAMKAAVAEALDVVNMDTVGAQERLARLDEEIAKAKTEEKKQELMVTRMRIAQAGGRLDARLSALKTAYDSIRSSGSDALTTNAYDEVISSKIQEVADMVGKTPLRNMSMEQLEAVHDLYTMVAKSISTANKTFKAARNESISQLGTAVMKEVYTVGGSKNDSIKALEGVKGFAWNNLKPVYAFKAIGSETLCQLFENVRAGEDVWAVDVQEAKEFYRKQAEQFGYQKWDFERRHRFQSNTGKEFELNLQQIMSLYAYSKRNQADQHLAKGGFVFDSDTVYKDKVKGIPVEKKIRTATAYNLSREGLGEIISTLTPEQKAFVDGMQTYLSEVMGAKGNEVSMALYDVKLFKEKNYFPLKSAKQFIFEQTENTGEVRLKNSGFSKKTVTNASNPVVLSGFMDVWASHVNDMSMYHAFVLPLEDFNRVFNYKSINTEDTDSESVKASIQNAYGEQAEKYIKQLLTDLNGGARVDPTTGFINKMMGKFKKGAVFASASVVIQQPSAIARAMATTG